MKKRLLSLLLCLVMVFSLFPSFAVPAGAVSGDEYAADGESSGSSTSGAYLRYYSSSYTKQVKFSATVTVSERKITNVSVSVTNPYSGSNNSVNRWNAAANSIAEAYTAKLKNASSEYYILGKDATLLTANNIKTATDSQYTTRVDIPTNNSYRLTDAQKAYFEYDMKQALIAAIQSATAYELKPNEEYIYTPVAMPSGGWKTDSNYGTEQLYALINDKYVPVELNRDNIYAEATDANGNVKDSWDAVDANEAYTRLGSLYYWNGTSYDGVYVGKNNTFARYTNLLDLGRWTSWPTFSHEDYGPYQNASDFYVYVPHEGGDICNDSCWHRVYYQEYGSGLITGSRQAGYYYTFYYFTDSMTGSLSNNITSGTKGSTLTIDGKRITLLCDHYECAIWGYMGAYWSMDGYIKEWTNSTGNGTDGYLYTVEDDSSYYNYMYTGSESNPTAVLACQAPNSYYSHTYSGNLYYALEGVTELRNSNTHERIPDSNYSNAKGDVLYQYPLYTRHIDVMGELDGVKTLSNRQNDGSYNLTIDSWATGPYQGYEESEETPVQPEEKTPLDIVLVMDQSGSMRTPDLEGNTTVVPNIQKDGSETWTLNELRSGTQYYYEAGGKYYPVQLGTGTLYSGTVSVRGNETFGWGNDGISVLVNGAPTYYNVRTWYYIYVDADGDGIKEMHRVRAITAGLDLHYGFYPYIYKDENSAYAQMGKWTDNHYWFRLISPWGANKLRNNTRWNDIINDDAISFIDTNGNLLGSSDSACNSAKMNYSWVTDTARMKNLYYASSRGYANLYYVDDNGKQQIIGTRFMSDEDFTTKGPLYTLSGGTRRVEALESAVNEFVTAVKADATESGHEVDHQIAIVGYAQNQNAAISPIANDAKVLGNNGLTSYTNTGLFSGDKFGNFKNYDKSPDYDNAFVSAGDITTDFTDTFGTWGGTYPSYGMDMAKEILQNGRNDAKKVVIVFTDGEPGEDGYQDSAAGDALINAADVKSMDGVEVYTVGLYPQSISSEGVAFLKQLSSEYTTTKNEVSASSMDPEETYFVESNGQYTAITTDYYGESSLGWWEDLGNGQYRHMNVKGANAGAGDEYLYDGSEQVAGENADIKKTYKSADGNPARYEYHWFDAEMNIVVPTGKVYTISNERQSGEYSQTTSTKAGLEEIFRELAKEIQAVEESTTPTATVAAGGAVNYDSSNSIIRDVISSDFSKENVSVKLELVPAEMIDGAVVEKTGVPALDVTASSDYGYSWDGKEITVTGYDFGANSIYKNHDGNIMRVTITGLQPKNTGKVYSNVESKSGIYKYSDDTVGDKLFSYKNPYTIIPTYTVNWNVDGNVVESDKDLPFGAFPSYDGEAPVKADDHTHTYTFVGWSSDSNAEIGVPVDELAAVPANADDDGVITYYAIFRKVEIKNYTVHWFNGDTELIEPTNYKSGEYPAYNGTEQPTRQGKYFVGWSTNADYEYDETTVEDNLYYGQKTVDQLAAGDSTTVNLYAIFAEKPGTLEVKEKNLVVEYSTKHEIDTNVYDFDVDVSSSSFGAFSKVLDKGDNPNGVGTLYFTANAVSDFGDKETGIDLSPLSGVNKATYYTGAPADSKENRTVTTVTVVPASSMYLDDTLTEVVAQSKGNKFDYKAALAGKNASEESTTEFAKGETLTFTFSAERIDVYCTTDGTGNSVMASLKDTSGALAKDKNGNTVKAQLSGNKLSNGGTVYNTPTISFTNLDPSQTYVLTVKAMTAKYRFDGIRVYNPSRAEGTEISNALSEANEQNARYQKVRDILLTDKTAFDSLGEDEAAVVFVDRIAGGETTGDIFADYKDYGPKNEVYLQPNQGIAFSVDLSAYNNAKVYVGMSSQSTDGQVYVSGTNPDGDSARVVTDVKSATEQYYEVTPDKNSVVVIKNAAMEGNNIISITNIKITGDLKSTESDSSPDVTAMFGARKMMLRSSLASFDNLDVVEENVTDEPVVVPGKEPSTEPSEDPGAEPTEVPSDEPTEEPVVETQTPEPSPSATTDPNNGGSFSSAISKIIQSVTNTISKLFKSLFRW